MNYQVKEWDTTNISEKEDGSADYQITVISRPVGDTYGFERGDSVIVNITDIATKTGAQIKAEVAAAAAAFVATKYPNT